MEKTLAKASKFVSLVLRHAPETIGLTLDPQGWAQVDELIAKSGGVLDEALLRRIVDENDKKRFSFSQDGRHIRANQGHSVAVDLGLEPAQPPAVLYHGTATRFLDAIRAEGLTAQGRQHVHLSMDVETAQTVGARHGKPAILTVDAAGMVAAGCLFFQSANGVWLTETVLPQFLSET